MFRFPVMRAYMNGRVGGYAPRFSSSATPNHAVKNVGEKRYMVTYIKEATAFLAEPPQYFTTVVETHPFVWVMKQSRPVALHNWWELTPEQSREISSLKKVE